MIEGAIQAMETASRMQTEAGRPVGRHSDIFQHRKNARDSDQPFAAVIRDLK